MINVVLHVYNPLGKFTDLFTLIIILCTTTTTKKSYVSFYPITLQWKSNGEPLGNCTMLPTYLPPSHVFHLTNKLLLIWFFRGETSYNCFRYCSLLHHLFCFFHPFTNDEKFSVRARVTDPRSVIWRKTRKRRTDLGIVPAVCSASNVWRDTKW